MRHNKHLKMGERGREYLPEIDDKIGKMQRVNTSIETNQKKIH